MTLKTMLSTRSKFLVIGGVIAAATAIWHWLCIIGGPSWFVFARAPQAVVESARQGTLFAPISTLLVGALFMSCTAYAFSGAGLIRKIPLLNPALISISILCILRGLYFMPYLLNSAKPDIWLLVSSLVWLFCGICFLLGSLEQFSSEKSKK